MKYMKERNGNLLIRTNKNGLLEKYDKTTNTWIRDYMLAEIYYGGIIVDEVSETEMNKLIKGGN